MRNGLCTLWDMELRLLRLLLGLLSRSKYRLLISGWRLICCSAVVGYTGLLRPGLLGVEGVITEGRALDSRELNEADGPIELGAGVLGVGAMSISIFRRMGSLCMDPPPSIHLPDLIRSSCFFRHNMQTQIILLERSVTFTPQRAQQRTVQ